MIDVGMSQKNGVLYFAPHISFCELDLTGQMLLNQFFDRISGFYLEAAHLLAQKHHAFACGLVVVCALVALAHARIRSDSRNVEQRIVGFCRSNINGLGEEQCAVETKRQRVWPFRSVRYAHYFLTNPPFSNSCKDDDVLR